MSRPTSDERFEPARQLWAGRFQAVLTTQSVAEPGYPFPSVVPYCLDREGRLLMLLSRLAQHTRNLSTDPRCGLSVSAHRDGDVQQSTRLACLGDVSAVDPADQAAHGRWFRYFPHTQPYREQLDFSLYRLSPKRFHFNGGFATARWLGSDQVLRDSPFDEAGETELLATLQDPVPRLSEDQVGAAAAPVRLVGIDPWGLDLARGERLVRIGLPGPLIDRAQIYGAIVGAASTANR